MPPAEAGVAYPVQATDETLPGHRPFVLGQALQRRYPATASRRAMHAAPVRAQQEQSLEQQGSCRLASQGPTLWLICSQLPFASVCEL